MALDQWWKNRRRVRVDDASKLLLGTDPRTSAGEDDLQAQRFKVGVFVRECFDSGFDPLTLIQTLTVGAVWLADNTGVSRDQLAKLVHAIEMKSERSLIFKPGE